MSIALDASTPELTARAWGQSLLGRAYATDWTRRQPALNHQISDETRGPRGIAVVPLLALQSLKPRNGVPTASVPAQIQN